MHTLIVGPGALGGLLAARLHAVGRPALLAARSAESAAHLRIHGLHASGEGGYADVESPRVESTAEILAGSGRFDLIVLATKAQEAVELAPRLLELLAPGGSLLPIQNGAVSQLLGERLGAARVLGGLSNLGATMAAPGRYEQRNAGHLLVGELSGGVSDRARRVAEWLGAGLSVRVSENLGGAIWSKLMLNCSGTTLGAIAGTTLRGYISLPAGREAFERTYGEALQVALASGARPVRMFVDPIPPRGAEYEGWLAQVVAAYGDLKPSMLQDFERRRPTEIDFINGYVAGLGRRLGVDTPVQDRIVAVVAAISAGTLRPDPAHLQRMVAPA